MSTLGAWHRTPMTGVGGLYALSWLTRTLLGPNHASLSVLIRKHRCRSMSRRLRIIAEAVPRGGHGLKGGAHLTDLFPGRHAAALNGARLSRR